MLDSLAHLHPVLQALLAGIFTWAMTAVGALPALLSRKFNQKVMDSMLGLAAGVMISASFWSLLEPALTLCCGNWVPVTFGFLAGGAFLHGADMILPHLHPPGVPGEAEGIRTRWRRSVLLVLAITLHNVPEGLALGVAFAAAGAGVAHASLGAAVALTLGMAIQNLPEGLAVAMPLRRNGTGRGWAFFSGQASGLVEPVAAVLGAYLVLHVTPALPWALSFAAGAMIFVVIEELVPESQRSGNRELAALSALVGFAIMTALDVGLG